MIRIEQLTKYYGEKLAIENVSFSVRQGEILGLLGPNGAGKTTTMRILTGYMPPTSGNAQVGEFNIWDHELQLKAMIGYLPENPPVYPDMSVRAYLDFVADLKGIPKESKIKEIDQVIEKVSIGDVQHRLIGVLSKGYRQRVGLAQALLGNPPVLVLDEPTVGLDPKQIIEIRSLIKNLSGDHTVVLSTHILPEVEMTCDRVVIIDKGHVVAEDTVENLTVRMQGNMRIKLELEGQPEVVEGIFKRFNTILNVEQENGQDGILRYFLETGEDIRKALARELISNNIELVTLDKEKLSLEDAFLHLTTKEEEVA
ncbi:MAG: ABC transporter ATP-binding protein [Calditrichia bacterium]